MAESSRRAAFHSVTLTKEEPVLSAVEGISSPQRVLPINPRLVGFQTSLQPAPAFQGWGARVQPSPRPALAQPLDASVWRLFCFWSAAAYDVTVQGRQEKCARERSNVRSTGPPISRMRPALASALKASYQSDVTR